MRIKFFLLLFLGLFSSITFAAEKILVIGDSISAGYGIEVKQGWVNLLQQRLQKLGYDYKVVNASISGDTTSNGLYRLPVALKQYQPAIVIIELGANDGLRGLQIETIEKNLAEMIKTSQQNNSKVLLLGIRIPTNYGPVYTQKFQAIYPKLAQHYKTAIVPLLLTDVDTQSKLIQADGLHPTAQAQFILLNNVWVALKPLLIEK